MRTRHALFALLLLPTLAFAARVADPLWTLLQAKDRTDEDRKEDANRKPLELLRFIAPHAGWKVADLGAGGGYTTELLVRAVGPTGKVYAQNSKEVIEKFVGPEWKARLARPINKNVVPLERPIDDPFPADVKDLDLVTNAFTYHDTVWLEVDRKKMNAAVFNALKKGGLYVILDHAGKPGSDATETKTLHRIEDKSVIADVEAAGFKLVKQGDFLRNPADPKTEGVFGSLRGKTDRFVLMFQKP